MLKIVVPETDLFNEETNAFSKSEAIVLELEHSLISLSKWESRFEKPFLAPGQKTTREILAYVEAMIITPDYPSNIVACLTKENLDDIQQHIDSRQTATTFRELPKSRGRTETVTSELVYYWMISYNIPLECEKWHLNRLFTLIRIFSVKNDKPKRMSRSAIAQQNRELNAMRRAQLGSRG